MKNESRAEKIIRKKIEEWTILKPTQMAREITEALIGANLISSNGMLADSYLPSELITLKKHYDDKLKGFRNGCKSHEQIEAEKISSNIEKRLNKMANNLR